MKTRDEILKEAFCELDEICDRVDREIPGSYFDVLTTFLAIQLDAHVMNDKMVCRVLRSVRTMVEAMRLKDALPPNRLIAQMMDGVKPKKKRHH